MEGRPPYLHAVLEQAAPALPGTSSSSLRSSPTAANSHSRPPTHTHIPTPPFISQPAALVCVPEPPPAVEGSAAENPHPLRRRPLQRHPPEPNRAPTAPPARCGPAPPAKGSLPGWGAGVVPMLPPNWAPLLAAAAEIWPPAWNMLPLVPPCCCCWHWRCCGGTGCHCWPSVAALQLP